MNLESASVLMKPQQRSLKVIIKKFMEKDEDYQKELNEWARRKIAQVDKEAASLEGQALTDYLTGQNHEIATHYNERTKALFF